MSHTPIHTFPELGSLSTKRNTIRPSSDFKCLAEEFLGGEERKDFPISQEELGKKIQEAERQAYLKGFREGELKGLAQGRKDLEPVINTLSDALKELERTKKEIYAQAEKDAIQLALLMAEKIIKKEIQSDISILANMLKGVLESIGEQQEFRIKINPSDSARLKALGYDIGSYIRDAKKVILEEDLSIESGGFVIVTESGELDGRIGSQLEAIKEMILETSLAPLV